MVDVIARVSSKFLVLGEVIEKVNQTIANAAYYSCKSGCGHYLLAHSQSASLCCAEGDPAVSLPLHRLSKRLLGAWGILSQCSPCGHPAVVSKDALA